MKQFQVKCRKCRHWLMSEESIVDCHGDSVQGDMAGWYCGAGAEREQIIRTHLFVSFSDTPPFIMTVVEQACYTQGKINCPKCQGRLGSFDFVRTNRKCPCGHTVLPRIHLLRDRIDLLPSAPQLSTWVSPAGQTTSATFRSHKLAGMRGRNDIQEEGEDGKGGGAITAESDMNIESVSSEENDGDTEENRTAEKKSAKEKYTAREMEENMVVTDSEDSGEYVITDLRWLFGESSSHQQCCACTDSPDAETHSTTDIHCCQCCSNTPPSCHSEDLSSETATHDHKHCSNVSMQTNLTSQGTNTSHSQQKSSVTMALQQDCSESRDGLTIDLHRPNSASSNNYSVTSPTQNRAQIFKKIREIRRRRKKCRDYDGRDELYDMNSDMSESPVHFPVVRPQSVPLHCQREKERREREAKEKRQIQEEELLWDHTCPMCLDVMWSPHTTLPCEHNFCEGCLRRLTTVISPSKSDCPLCRQRIAQCVPNTDLEMTIQDKYPARLRLRRREEKRTFQRVKHTPLPGLPFPHRYLSQLPRHRLRLPRAFVTWVAVVLVSLMVVVMLSSLGMAICKKVLHKLAEVYDDLMERLTGERLWSRFMGGESRMLTVSCVFVLYLLVACVVQYLQLFQHLQN